MPQQGPRRRAAPQRRSAGTLLGAAAVGGLLAFTGVTVTGLVPGAAPALAAQAEQREPADRVAPQRPAAPRETGTADEPAPAVEEEVATEETSEAVAFLDALRAADVPTSRRGLAEVRIAQAVCEEDAKGTSHDLMAEGIPSVLPTVTSRQAAVLIDAALEHYC